MGIRNPVFVYQESLVDSATQLRIRYTMTVSCLPISLILLGRKIAPILCKTLKTLHLSFYADLDDLPAMLEALPELFSNL
jgi:hypothetical protein